MLRETVGLKEDFVTGMKEFIYKSKENRSLIGRCEVELYDKDGTLVQTSKAENTIKDHMFLENFYAIYDYIVHNFHHDNPDTPSTSNYYPGPIHSIRLLNRKFSKKESNKIHMNKTDFQDELIGYANTHVPVTNTDSTRGTINDNEMKLGYEWIDGKLYQKIEIVLDFPTNSSNGTFNLVETRMYRMDMPWHRLGMWRSRVSTRLGDDWYGYPWYGYGSYTDPGRNYQYLCKAASRATVRDHKIYYLEIYPEHNSIYRRIRLAEAEMGSTDVTYRGETTDDLEVKYPLIYSGHNCKIQHCVKMSEDKKYMYVLMVRSSHYWTLTKIDWKNNKQVWATYLVVPTLYYSHDSISECGAGFIIDEDTMTLKVVYDTALNTMNYMELTILDLVDMGWSRVSIGCDIKVRARLGYIAELEYYKGDKNRLIIVRRGAIGYDQHTSVYELYLKNIQTSATVDRPLIPILGDCVNGSFYYDKDNDVFICKRDASAQYVQPNNCDTVFSEDEIVPITKSAVNTMKLRYIFYTPVPKAAEPLDCYEFSSMSSDKKHVWSTLHPHITSSKLSATPVEGGIRLRYRPGAVEKYSDNDGLVLLFRSSNDGFVTYEETIIPLEDSAVKYLDGYKRITPFNTLFTKKTGLVFRVYVFNFKRQTTSSTYIQLSGTYSPLAKETYDNTMTDWVISGENIVLNTESRIGVSDITVNGTSLGAVKTVNIRTNAVDGQENVIVVTYESGRIVRYTFTLPANEDYTVLTQNNYTPLAVSASVDETDDYLITYSDKHQTWSAPYLALTANAGCAERGWHTDTINNLALEDNDLMVGWLQYESKGDPITFDTLELWFRSHKERLNDFILKTSDDGETWTTVLDEVDTANCIKEDEPVMVYKLSESVTAQFIRIESVSRLAISGIKFYNMLDEHPEGVTLAVNRACTELINVANDVIRPIYSGSEGWYKICNIMSEQLRLMKLKVTYNDYNSTSYNGISFYQGYHHSDGRELKMFIDKYKTQHISKYMRGGGPYYYDFRLYVSDVITFTKEVVVE